MSENTEIPAIHDDDLKKILRDYNLLDKIGTEEVKCICCQTVITWNNLSGIMLKNSVIHFVCDSPDCIDDLRKID